MSADRSGCAPRSRVAVGVVLADSSVVVLALPEIYRELDVSVTAVTWVLVAFNLVLALAALPAAQAARRLGAARVALAGIVDLRRRQPRLRPLRLDRSCCSRPAACRRSAARAAVCASLELLPSVVGSERRAATVWAASGALGAALGPGLGGLLTELISWQSIFFVQVPVAVVCGAVAARPGAARALARAARGAVEPAGRPHLAANAALALVSAALAAALFLIVLLLIEGWRLSPIGAAAAVTVMPICALAAAPLAGRVESTSARAAAGVILIGGGLAGLGLLPDASVLLTLPPQALVGAGLALTLSALTEAALAGRAPQAIHGGWTIAARHAGVVAGLLVLTPVFTADLETERAARRAGRDRRAARLRGLARVEARPGDADRRPDRGRGRQGPGARAGVRARCRPIPRSARRRSTSATRSSPRSTAPPRTRSAPRF